VVNPILSLEEAREDADNSKAIACVAFDGDVSNVDINGNNTL
jgi:hypothetical protein